MSALARRTRALRRRAARRARADGSTKRAPRVSRFCAGRSRRRRERSEESTRAATLPAWRRARLPAYCDAHGFQPAGKAARWSVRGWLERGSRVVAGLLLLAGPLFLAPTCAQQAPAASPSLRRPRRRSPLPPRRRPPARPRPPRRRPLRLLRRRRRPTPARRRRPPTPTRRSPATAARWERRSNSSPVPPPSSRERPIATRSSAPSSARSA